jgi:preprotein translocase SecE subunit
VATESEDKKTAPADAQPEAGKKARRRLKPAPTIREQSEQAAARAGQPKKRSAAGKVLSAPFRLIGWLLKNTIGRVFRFLGRYKIFRFIGYIFVPPYFRSAWKELRLVTWPGFRQTLDLTVAVIIFSIIFAAIVGIVDYGLDKVFRAIISNG